MEFAIQAVKPMQSSAERVRVENSPSSTQQDVVVDHTEREPASIKQVADVQKARKSRGAAQ